MKLNEIQLYKTIGTIQRSRDEDGKTIYFYTHNFFGVEHNSDTIKDAKEMLDWYEEDAQKIRQALRVLQGKGYKVFKEMA